MPKEVYLYNLEIGLPPRATNSYTRKLVFEARRTVDPDLEYEIHQFTSKSQLEQQLQNVFEAHQTKPITKLMLDLHGDIGYVPPEGAMLIKQYKGNEIGDRIGRFIFGDDATEVSGILKKIKSQTRIQGLDLICCQSGVLSVENNLARAFLRSNLFDYVVGYDMRASLRRSTDPDRTNMPLSLLSRYEPDVFYTPDPANPTDHTTTYLRYCAPNGGFRPTEGRVVFYYRPNPRYPNGMQESWTNYKHDLPFHNMANHVGKPFPTYVTK